MIFRSFATVISTATVTTMSATIAAWAQMPAPPAGAKYIFDCTSSVNPNYEEVYTIVSSDGTSLRVEVDDGIDRNWYEKPLYLLNTTMASRQNIRGLEVTMPSIPGEFRNLAALNVGGEYSGYVVERRPKERLEWNYTVSVLGRETVYNRAFGDLKVVNIKESRWVNVFSSDLDVQYAPDLAFPLSWAYKDSNGAEVECELSAAEGLGAGAIAAATAGDSPATTASPVLIASPMRLQAIVNANVREQPTREAPRVGLLGDGTQISVSGYVEIEGERWYALPLDNGTTGYVFASLLKAAESSASAPPEPEPAKSGQQAAPAPQAAPASQAAAPAPRAAVATAPAAGAAAAGDTETRLKELDELRRLDLITETEYQSKRKELLGAAPSAGIADQLRQTNSLFRQGKINPEEFVKARADILAKINAVDMDAKDGLVLLNDLINERLISEAEYSRKRAIMLDAL